MEAARARKRLKRPPKPSTFVQLPISSFFNAAGTAAVTVGGDLSTHHLPTSNPTLVLPQVEQPVLERSNHPGDGSVTDQGAATTAKMQPTERLQVLETSSVATCADDHTPDIGPPGRNCARSLAAPAAPANGEPSHHDSKGLHLRGTPANGPWPQPPPAQRMAISPAALVERNNTEMQTFAVPADMAAAENELEKEREERILRNKMILAELGLQQNFMASGASSGNKPKAKHYRAPLRSSYEKANIPLRRSSRTRGIPAETHGFDPENCAPEIAEPELPVVFDDSKVLQYVCDVAQCSRPDSDPPCENGHLEGYHMLTAGFSDSNLTRAYGMDAHAGLLAAGGQRGIVSVWGNRQHQEYSKAECEPLMSAQLDRGWICDVQFLRSGSDGGPQPSSSVPPLLLTASNNAVVALWDLSSATSEGMPHQLMENSRIHSGGIFSMHARGASVLTASKDCSVAVSFVRSEGASMDLNSRLTYHTGVVKCARWRDENVISSCGADRTICIHDLRMPSAHGKPPSSTITNTHSGPVNYLQWNPFNDSLLLSSGGDKSIQVYDIRNTKCPIHTFCGHMLKGQSIYQPLWTEFGRAILTGGDTSKLSLYCCQTGETRSRGHLGFNPKATLLHASSGNGSHVLYLSTSKRVVACSPSWKALQ